MYYEYAKQMDMSVSTIFINKFKLTGTIMVKQGQVYISKQSNTEMLNQKPPNKALRIESKPYG